MLALAVALTPSVRAWAQIADIPDVNPPYSTPPGGLSAGPDAAPPPPTAPPNDAVPVAPALAPPPAPVPAPVVVPLPAPPIEEPGPPPASEAEKESSKESKKSDDDIDAIAAQEVAPRPNAKGDPFGDEQENGGKTHGFAFRLLLQTRYTRIFDDGGSSGTGQDNNGFQLNRAFLRGTVRPYKWLSAKLLVDFAEFAYSNPEQALKLAYGEIKPFKRVEITVGLFKRTYSLLELLPIALYEFADTGPTDNLIKDTQFGGRDVGVMVRGEPLPKKRWLQAYLGAFGGPGEGAEGLTAVNGVVHTGPDLAAPSLLLTARLQSRPLKHLALGVDGAWRPDGTENINLPPVSQVTSGKAVSADATYSNDRIELRGEWLWGDRTDIAYRMDARTFMAAWGIAAVRFRVEGVTVMPAARFEWLNADRQQDEGQRYLISGALNLDFTSQIRLLLDLSRAQVEAGTVPFDSIPGVFSHDATVFVVQAQLKI